MNLALYELGQHHDPTTHIRHPVLGAGVIIPLDEFMTAANTPLSSGRQLIMRHRVALRNLREIERAEFELDQAAADAA